jgi:DNA polymerase-3 subunit epsilon
MREVILDTETTGLDPAEGDRLVEIACLELVNQVPTGEKFQAYINPERDVPETAVRVHGLTSAFLSDKPKFPELADRLLEFIGEAPLVIHNAEFDLGFINAELGRIGRPALPLNRAIDTVKIARRKFPGAPASLDALCKRFGIDNSAREVHGALLDARLLAEVYLMLQGGRQAGLALDAGGSSAMEPRMAGAGSPAARTPRPARPHAPSDAELAAHKAFMADIKNPIWNG